MEDANPFHGLHAAVTRRPREGADPRLAARPAHDARGGGALLHDLERAVADHEGRQGSLEPGKRADLVALSDDVFTCPEGRIKDIVPALTMVGGEIVYRRGI